MVDSPLHEENMQNKVNVINLLQKSNESIWWLCLEQKFWNFTLPQSSAVCFQLSIIHFQMENNLKNTLEGNNISLMKNVPCFRPNHQTICRPRFIFVEMRLVTTLHQNTQSSNIVLLQESRAQHVLGNNNFYASAQNKSLCNAKHAAPVQTLFGCV